MSDNGAEKGSLGGGTAAVSRGRSPLLMLLWVVALPFYVVPTMGILFLTGVWARVSERLHSAPGLGTLLNAVEDALLVPVKAIGRLFIKDEASLAIAPYLLLPFLFMGFIVALIRDFSWPLAVLYLVVLMGPRISHYTAVTGMLHRNAHAPGGFFKAPLNKVEWYFFEWFFGLFHGTLPGSLPYSHCRMHHVCDNNFEDPASTLNFDRDSFPQFLMYAMGPAVLYIGGFSPLLFFYQRKRKQTFRDLGLCMLAFYGVLLFLLWWDWRIAVVVQLLPLLLNASAFAIANWVQHGFYNPADPFNVDASTTTILNPPLLLNENHHHAHHVKPAQHWTKDPVWFDANRERMGPLDPIVFDQIPTVNIWLAMMRKDWEGLARSFVILNPNRRPEEVPALLAQGARRFVG